MDHWKNGIACKIEFKEIHLGLLANPFVGTFADWENILFVWLNLLPDHTK